MRESAVHQRRDAYRLEVGGIVARAKVVRAETRVDQQVELGLAYVLLGSPEAEHLRRFVFTEQLRRRGTARDH